MSRKEPDVNGERMSKSFAKTSDILLSNSKNSQRSQNSKKNNNYVPNLVGRNKNLDAKKTNETEQKKDTRGSRNQRGNARKAFDNHRPNPNYVQQMGFLSEGIGDAVKKRSEYSGGGYSKGSSARAETIEKPRLMQVDQQRTKEDLENEQKILKSFLEDDDDSNDSKALSDEIVPIKIEDDSSTFVKREVSDDIKVKLEPCDGFDGSPTLPVKKIESTLDASINENSVKLEFKSEYSHQIDKLFHSESNQVVLFQMPDTLPQKLQDDEEDGPKMEGTTENAGEPVQSKPMKLSTLQDFNEGVVGKLIRHRSGKTKLMIGDYLYDLEAAIPTEFKQNAVSISSNSQERSANMFSLGEISTKYNVIPDWNWMFDKLATK